MLDVPTAIEPVWGDTEDWQALADRGCRAALKLTTHGEWIGRAVQIEVSVRFTDDAEVQTLNAQYRGKDKPTNVLSFPMVQPDLLDGLANTDDGEVLLGDIVLAHGVCTAEAEEKGIAVADHAIHLVVHGMLHLLGYDHIDDMEAEKMEAIERDALATLGLPDPYLIRED